MPDQRVDTFRATWRRTLLVGMLSAGVSSAAAALPKLTVQGARLVDPNGDAVVLRGCNLGNWFLLEPWMLDLDQQRYADHFTIVETLKQRFGAERATALLNIYREHWFGEREFNVLQSFGFNVVRLPFHYDLLTEASGPLQLKPDSVRWLDRAIDLAEAVDLYVILDLHGAPGGQSIDMPSGRVDQNELWTTPAHQQRTIWLWEQLAQRYRDRNAVVAYDLLNEPWGDMRSDMRQPVLDMCDKLITAIRKIDEDKLIYVPGVLQGVSHYGPPAERGWTNVGVTEHFYPGIHGPGELTLETHRHFLNAILPPRAALMQRWRAPYLAGEFNVVADLCAADEVNYAYFKRFAEYEWQATLWSARRITSGGMTQYRWSLMANAEPFVPPDPHTATYEALATAFRELGTQPLAVDTKLQSLLTGERQASLQLLDPKTQSAPTHPQLADGWRVADVGVEGPLGGVTQHGATLRVCGVGGDIWSDFDAFRFVHRPVTGMARQTVWIPNFHALEFAKAGIMLRADERPDSPHAFVHVFSDGRVVAAWRAERGGRTNETTIATLGFPVGLGLERTDAALWLHYADFTGNWRRVAFPGDVKLPADALLGMAVNSRDGVAAACATFDGVAESPQPSPALTEDERNWLTNGSFETAGDDTQPAPQTWRAWGAGLVRAEAETAPQGDAVAAYRHETAGATRDVGWYQDVALDRRQRFCTFSILARRDSASKADSDAARVELRLEMTHQGRQIAIASRTYDAAHLSADNWARLHVAGLAPASNVRVLLVVSPAEAAPRGGDLLFDDARLTIRAAPPFSDPAIPQPSGTTHQCGDAAPRSASNTSRGAVRAP